LANHIGKRLDLSDEGNNRAATKFAHILQGYEAQFIQEAIRHYGDNISLLSHDGFVTRAPIDHKVIVVAFQEKTGLEIQVETTQLAA